MKVKSENKFLPSASVISSLQASEIIGLQYEICHVNASEWRDYELKRTSFFEIT